MFSHPITLQDSRYLLKGTINILHFLHRDSNQGKIRCKTTAG